MEELEMTELPRTIDPEYFQNHLLYWYHKNKRKMPWRDEPTPYHVWISEIMLQQTRVEAAQGYYLRFIERLPDVNALAEVDDEELHKLWEGLGYYNRARNLKKSAQILVNEYGGKLPPTYEGLLKLPGIGPYTAGAIASIAFHEAVPAVDGNVMRVISRISGDRKDIMKSSTRKEMEGVVQNLIPPKEVHHFNQALMELGALVCIPNGVPHCQTCPAEEICYAYETKTQGELPIKKAKKERKIEKRSVLIFLDEEGKFFIQKRKKKGLLSGLWEFLSIEGHISKGELEKILKREGISVLGIKKIESSKHIFSHIEWHMKGHLIKISKAENFPPEQGENGRSFSEKQTLGLGGETFEENSLSGEGKLNFEEEGRWCDFEELKETYTIPTAFKAYIKSMEEGLVREATLE